MTKIVAVSAATLVAVVMAANAHGATIHGCVRQSSGKLRIVGVPGQCKSSEAAISWESEGPQGQEGPQGPEGPAGPPGVVTRFELVGFTTATYTGNEGVLGFSIACQAEFVGSRMCTSDEVMKTADVPTGLSGTAWVRPVFVPAGSGFADSSGVADGSSNALTCGAWLSASSSGRGLSVTAAGAFGDQRTCDEFLSVACCAPTPP